MAFTISVCLIVRDEEETLARCLDCTGDVANEIVIVDTGSKDATKEVAAKYTDKIYDFEWIDNFAAARNFAFSKATCDYILWLDADDVIPNETINAINDLRENGAGDVDIYAMPYVVSFDSDGNPALTSTRERIIRRGAGYEWQGAVHECIPLNGNVYYLYNVAIHHKKTKPGDPMRNIRIYESMEWNLKPFTPRDLYYFGRELADHARWEKAAHYLTRFLDTGKGWVEDNINACLRLSNCFNALGQEYNVLRILIHAFEYDAPRPDICSEIGYYYKRQENWALAASWFETAAALPQRKSTGFVADDYLGYLPNIEASVCYSALGNDKAAERFNTLAATFKETEQTRHNAEYFKAKAEQYTAIMKEHAPAD
jgi:glycosyltransferase involved in cell wall biosynthesis